MLVFFSELLYSRNATIATWIFSIVINSKRASLMIDLYHRYLRKELIISKSCTNYERSLSLCTIETTAHNEGIH